MIKQLRNKLINKEVTAVSLVEKYLNRIEEKNSQYNVFLDVYQKEALEQAEKVDKKIAAGELIGELEGIPCAIKDNICIKGKRTTASSKILENYQAPYNATVIKKLREAGVIILGKTNLDEFAMGSSTENSAFGVTRNPHDPERVAGGSSGGSAAAVAAGMAVWALGSDTGGSIRQPASLCGVVGFKPTYGRVSRYGLIAMASSLDQIGPLANTVEDAWLVFRAIKGKDQYDNTTVQRPLDKASSLKGNLRGKKIGISVDFLGEGLDQRIEKAVFQKTEEAKQKGAEIIELELPHLKYSLAAYYLIQPSEVSANLARFDGIKYGLSAANEENNDRTKNILDVYYNSREKGFGIEPKRRIILGTYALSAGYYEAFYKKAQQARELIKKDFSEAFEKVDAIISPTSPTPAFKIGERSSNPLAMYLADIYTVSANIAGIPAVSLPVGWVTEEDKKLPIGIQLMGKWWDEKGLLEIAAGMEEKDRKSDLDY
jgi:aspartyl-tRNA(Asn)/glutamyl-tRNA(Gln) amidotransferase subunit A